MLSEGCGVLFEACPGLYCCSPPYGGAWFWNSFLPALFSLCGVWGSPPGSVVLLRDLRPDPEGYCMYDESKNMVSFCPGVSLL